MCVCVFVVLGVNLLIGTDGGMMLLDRSGQGKGACLSTMPVNFCCSALCANSALMLAVGIQHAKNPALEISKGSPLPNLE